MRWLLGALFVALAAVFAVALWATVVRPRAYEVRGVLVARPAPNLILVRHEAVAALGMSAMEMMAVSAEPALVDAARVKPGDAVRLAVKPRDDTLTLLRIEKSP